PLSLRGRILRSASTRFPALKYQIRGILILQLPILEITRFEPSSLRACLCEASDFTRDPGLLIQGTRITEAYARTVMRDAYFWAWPLINIYNKRLAFEHIPEPGRPLALRPHLLADAPWFPGSVAGPGLSTMP